MRKESSTVKWKEKSRDSIRLNLFLKILNIQLLELKRRTRKDLQITSIFVSTQLTLTPIRQRHMLA